MNKSKSIFIIVFSVLHIFFCDFLFAQIEQLGIEEIERKIFSTNEEIFQIEETILELRKQKKAIDTQLGYSKKQISDLEKLDRNLQKKAKESEAKKIEAIKNAYLLLKTQKLSERTSLLNIQKKIYLSQKFINFFKQETQVLFKSVESLAYKEGINTEMRQNQINLRTKINASIFEFNEKKEELSSIATSLNKLKQIRAD